MSLFSVPNVTGENTRPTQQTLSLRGRQTVVVLRSAVFQTALQHDSVCLIHLCSLDGGCMWNVLVSHLTESI